MTFENLATRVPALGGKRQCVSCAARFYDMTKAPPVCPKCGAVQPPEAPRPRAAARAPVRVFKTRAPARAEVEEDAAPAEETEAEDEAEDADADADEVIEEVEDDTETIPGLSGGLAHDA
ncbi:MAG: TIGR02300 family protein [Proteobacteria bacterium]|nr:TIGR02300 family protein [Pseudomonadota bacterium]